MSRHTWPSTLAAALALSFVAGCGDDGAGSDGGPGVDGSRPDVDCQADLTLALPDGTSTVNDYCQFRQIQAEFEFDFDAPPEVRNARLRLYAATTAEVDCYVEITLPEACAPGVYPIDGTGNAVRMVTLDCSGVTDAFEGTFVASSGYVRVDEFNAGSASGFFTGMPLVTRFNGFVSVTSPEGVRLEGPFIAREQLLGVDAEGAVCETPLGDGDGDGDLSAEYGGSDCDDTNPAINVRGSEACNGVDDDCDGMVDDNLPMGGPCEVGLGACQRTGTLVGACDSSGGGQMCDATAGTPAEETCNMIDDDCDGRVDDDVPGAPPCTVGLGACERSGSQVCTGGSFSGCSVSAGASAPEACNSVDDDCDGVVDNGLARACSTACGSGVEVCAAGAWGMCDAPPVVPEGCNDIDDDCNGVIDDGTVCFGRAPNATCATAERLPENGMVTSSRVNFGGAAASGSGCGTGVTGALWYTVSVPPLGSVAVVVDGAADAVIQEVSACGSSCTAAVDAVRGGGVEVWTTTNTTTAARTVLLAIGGRGGDRRGQFEIGIATERFVTGSSSCIGIDGVADAVWMAVSPEFGSTSGTAPMLDNRLAPPDVPIAVPAWFSTFNYYGGRISTLRFDSNGRILINPSATAASSAFPASIPSGTAAGFIAPYWTDLLASALAPLRRIQTREIGSAGARIFVVDYRNWRTATDSDTSANLMSFQVHFVQSTGEIQFHYCQTPAGGTGLGATIGAQSVDGSAGTLISFDSETVDPGVGTRPNSSFRFLPLASAPCAPSCTGRTCGADGCGGSCGTCSAGTSCNASGMCVTSCTPSCAGRTCGSDGCGGSCGTCPSGTTCNASGMCSSSCTPSCSGRMCGSDGCGGSCGTCSTGTTCNASGMCVSSSTPAIGSACTMDSQCGAGRICLPEAGGWPGGYCSLDCTSATCPSGSTCITGAVDIDVCLANCPPACRAGYTCTAAGTANVCF
jgi:hypothetical protein